MPAKRRPPCQAKAPQPRRRRDARSGYTSEAPRSRALAATSSNPSPWWRTRLAWRDRTPSANSATFRSPIDDAAANPCAATSTTDPDRSGPTQLRRPVPTASAPDGTSTSPAIALLGSRGALLALGVRRAGGRSDGMARPMRARPAHARRDADIELLHQVALRRPLPQLTIRGSGREPERVVFAPGTTVFERKAKRASRSTSSACWPASA
jgi:hypothetical protein